MVNLKRAKNGDKTTFEVRAGATRMLGMRPDVHPAALAPNEFVRLINTRRIGPDLVGRPGQIGLCDLSEGCRVTGMADLQLGTLRQMFLVFDGCPGQSATAGHSLSSFTIEQLPKLLRQVYEPAATHLYPVKFTKGASIDGLIPPVDGMFFSIDNKLYRRQTIPVPYGTDPLNTTGGSQKVLVWTAPDTYSHISALCQHGSVLLIACQGAASAGAGTSAILRWDGLTFSVDDDGLNPITGFAPFRDLMIAGFGGSPSYIRVRDSAGVWTTVLPGDAGAVALLGSNRSASYQDKLYFPIGDDILCYDGTTMTRFAPATTGVDPGATIYGVARAFGYLFASWSTAAKTMILRFDGTTWEPEHKDLRDGEPDLAARSIRLFQGCLLVAATTIADGAKLYRSPRRDTAGTYQTYLPTQNPAGDIAEMVEV